MKIFALQEWAFHAAGCASPLWPQKVQPAPAGQDQRPPPGAGPQAPAQGEGKSSRSRTISTT